MDLIEKNRRFFDRWARFYDFGPVAWWLRAVQRSAILMLRPRKGERILDASCGTGHALKQLAKTGAHLVGLDLSSAMLEKARRNLAGLSVDLIEGNVLAIPFPEESFDCVMTTEAFHHYPDQAGALGEFFRVLKPGGRLLLVDINLFLAPLHRLFEKIEPGCVRINTRKEIRALVKDTGFVLHVQRRIGCLAVATCASRPAHSTKHL